MNCNYKVKITDIQTKYKFKVFCTGYDDSEIKEKIDAMYQAWPKATAEGETPTLDNTANATMSIDLKGNTSQETTTGKNLLNIPNMTITHNGISFTLVDSNIMSFSGTATGTWANLNASSLVDNPMTSGQAYTFSIDTAQNIRVVIYETTPQIAHVISEGNKYVNFQSNGAGNIFIGLTNLTVGTSYSGTIKMQLEAGSTATAYEPYTNGASPNPDYPQDVEVVTGDNTINICGKNLFNKNTITTSAYLKEDGTLQTGTGAEYITSDFIPVQPNTTYYKTQTLSPRTKFYDANKQVLDNSTYQDISIGGNAGSFTTPSNAYYFRFTGNVNTSTGININNVMVHKGSEATTYEAYTGASYPVNLGTMELCKIGDYQDYIYKDNKKWYKYGVIDKVVLDGTQNITLANGTPRRFNATYTTLGIDNVKSGTTAVDTQSNYRMCDHFGYTSGGNTWGNYYLHNNWLVMLDGESVMSNANALKTWLGNNNTNIYYVLETPETTEITDATLISQLNALAEAESYSGQTNISQTNDDKPFILTAKALKDLSNL